MKKLLFICILLLTSLASARIYWQDVDQEVTIRPDGSVHVRDERTLRATGDDDFGEAYICIDHAANQRVVLGSASGAVDLPRQATAFSQACEDNPNGTELVVRYNSRRSQGRVLFEYELHNTVSQFSDTAEWYWEIYGRRNVEAERYSLTVHAPGPMDFPYDAVVYRFNNPNLPVVGLSEDRSRLDVTFSRIPSRMGVEIRWYMDPALFTGRGSEPGLERILTEIARAENIMVPGAPQLQGLQWPESVDREEESVLISGRALPGAARVNAVRASVGSAINELCTGIDPFECQVFGLEPGDNRVTIQAVDVDGRIVSQTVNVERLTLIDEVRRSPWAIIPGAAILAWLIQLVSRVRREHRDPPSDGMMYPFEPPNDLPPAAVVSLITKPGVASNSNGFAATVMDLARRGFIEFDGEGRNFSMLVDMEAPPADLLGFEADVLTFLRGAASFSRATDARGWRKVTNRELKRQGQLQQNFMTLWGNNVLKWVRDQYTRGELRDPVAQVSGRSSLLTAESSRAATSTLLLGLLGMGALGLLFLATEGPASLAYLVLAASALVIALSAIGARRWKDHVAKDVYHWQGFRRTLTDYTRMKDAPNDFFVLWDRYFVYAAALGVARRYLNNIQKLADERGISATQLAHSSTWMAGSTASLTDLASFARNVSAMSSSLSSAISSAGVSASSGGSSAGGGGGR